MKAMLLFGLGVCGIVLSFMYHRYIITRMIVCLSALLLVLWSIINSLWIVMGLNLILVGTNIFNILKIRQRSAKMRCKDCEDYPDCPNYCRGRFD